MSSNIPFGYEYVDGKVKAVSDEIKQTKSIFTLFNNYNLNQNEIVNLINGSTTIKEIIIFRIEKICEILKLYDQSLDNILVNNNQITQDIIEELIGIKERMKKLNGLVDEVIFSNIDDVILLINKQEEIKKILNF